jgi:hypothetical protein
MKNSVVASVVFYFKGERHAPALAIDLDELMAREGGVERLHHAIAIANRIDAYSYEYEVMQAEELFFDEPQGLAVEYCHDGEFDFEGYRARWQELQVLERVRPIAERCVGVSDLDAKPKLKAALIAAYLAGKGEGG